MVSYAVTGFLSNLLPAYSLCVIYYIHEGHVIFSFQWEAGSDFVLEGYLIALFFIDELFSFIPSENFML